jgi:hypothetical protein
MTDVDVDDEEQDQMSERERLQAIIKHSQELADLLRRAGLDGDARKLDNLALRLIATLPE